MSSNKDPAFLFYPSDFMVGTFFMSDEEVGKYIRLLCLQHQRGHLSEDEFSAICQSDKVRCKFVTDDQGRLYNIRLEAEIIKRNEYKEKQRKNGALGGRSKAKALLEQTDSTAKAPLKQASSTRVENENINTNTIKDIIEYLNEVLGTKYKYSADYIKKHINARLSEGYTLEDFKTVIDKKYRSWSGTEMAKFLRPETLFGTKFASYLNELEGEEKKNDGIKEPYRSTELYGEYVG